MKEKLNTGVFQIGFFPNPFLWKITPIYLKANAGNIINNTRGLQLFFIAFTFTWLDFISKPCTCLRCQYVNFQGWDSDNLTDEQNKELNDYLDEINK